MARFAVRTAAPILSKNRGAWPAVQRATECFLACFSGGGDVYDGLHQPVADPHRPYQWGKDPPIRDQSENEDHVITAKIRATSFSSRLACRSCPRPPFT